MSRNRRWPRLRVVLLPAVLAMVGLAVPAGASAGGTYPVPVGVSPGSHILYKTAADQRAELLQMARAGSKWVRLDVPWADIEPVPGSYQWSTTDNLVSTATSLGMKVDGILDDPPAWADASGVLDSNVFAEFARAVADRYAGAGAKTWEILNEPNLAVNFPGGVNPVAYAALLGSAYSAVHSVAPGETVLVGGLARSVDAMPLAMDPVQFLTDVLATGTTALDAVAVHPYSYPFLPDQASPAGLAYENPFLQLPEMHQIMASYGQGAKKIWVTEYGAPTSDDQAAVSPKVQAKMISGAYSILTGYSFVGPMMVFNWIDEQGEDFGLFYASGVAKPAFAVFQRIAQ